jgi:hypothetical protein
MARTSLATLVVICLLLAAGWAGATSTRILSLGGDGDYFEDSFNVLRWYGSLPGYGDLAVLELGDFFRDRSGERQVVHQGAGVHAHLDSNQRWGTGAFYVSDISDPYQVPGTLSLLWSRRFASIQGGLSYQWTLLDDSVFDSGAMYRAKESNSSLGIALRFDLAERLYVDLAGDWIGTWRQYHGSYQDMDPFADEERNVWQSYDLRGRAFWGVTEKVALVPVVVYQVRSHLTFLDLLSVPADLDGHQMRLGLGLNLFPDSDNMLVFSYEYRFGEENFDAKDNPFDLIRLKNEFHSHRLRLGLESRLTSWLILRGGAVQVMPDLNSMAHFQGLDGPETIEAGSEDPQLDLNLGLGLQFGAFDADLVFNDDAPFALGHFLTGGGEDRSSNFTSITLQYNF